MKRQWKAAHRIRRQLRGSRDIVCEILRMLDRKRPTALLYAALEWSLIYETRAHREAVLRPLLKRLACADGQLDAKLVGAAT